MSAESVVLHKLAYRNAFAIKARLSAVVLEAASVAVSVAEVASVAVLAAAFPAVEVQAHVFNYK